MLSVPVATNAITDAVANVSPNAVAYAITDVVANNGTYAVASTGTDAAPYFRVFNPISQSEKFDSDGTFIRTWVPELAELRGKDLHDPSRIAPLLRSDLDYPELIVEQKFGRQRAIDAFKTARASL